MMPIRIEYVAFLVLTLQLSGISSNQETSIPAPIPGLQFVDVAEASGLVQPNVWGGIDSKEYIIEAKGSGLGLLDFDNDGWLDLYISNGKRFDEKYSNGIQPTTLLYKNNQDGTFSDVSKKSGIAVHGWQTGVCAGDFNNDGFEDLFCGFWGKNRLFLNQGDGSFADVSQSAGLDSDEKWTSGCSWVDYDLDGNLDLYIANYIGLDLDKIPKPEEEGGCVWKGVPVLCGPSGLPGEYDSLYHNQGDGTFEDVSVASGISQAGPRYSISTSAADFTNDGWPDIYVAVDSQPSMLFENNQDGTFEEVGLIAGCAYGENGENQAGMGIGVGDYNCDGALDIFKTNFQHDTCNLYKNSGDGMFSDVSAMAGISRNMTYVNWGAGFVDYDNDGRLDIFHVTGHVYPRAEQYNVGAPLKTPRKLYRNLGNGKFSDVSAQTGPGITQKFASRGCAFGDIDNDGDIDIAILNMNDRPSLLRNDGGNQNSWISLKLTGMTSNRSAIGARVRIHTGDHVQTNEVLGGGSVMSQNDLRLHFGVGKAEIVDRIEVRWPGSEFTTVLEKVKVNQQIEIREGRSE